MLQITRTRHSNKCITHSIYVNDRSITWIWLHFNLNLLFFCVYDWSTWHKTEYTQPWLTTQQSLPNKLRLKVERWGDAVEAKLTQWGLQAVLPPPGWRTRQREVGVRCVHIGPWLRCCIPDQAALDGRTVGLRWDERRLNLFTSMMLCAQTIKVEEQCFSDVDFFMFNTSAILQRIVWVTFLQTQKNTLECNTV